jgi:hypothetical protein
LAKFEETQFGVLGELISARVKTLKFADFLKIRANLVSGQISYVDFQANFASLCASRESLLRELKARFSAPQLSRLATAFGVRGAKRANRNTNAERIYRGMLRTFVLDSKLMVAADDGVEVAVTKAVHAMTSQDLLDHYFKKAWEAEQRRQAISDLDSGQQEKQKD